MTAVGWRKWWDDFGGWDGLGIALILVIFVLTVSLGVYHAMTTKCVAFEYQWVLVPVEGNAAVLTPMSTGICAKRVPK